MAHYCSRCGGALTADDAFCPRCGNRVSAGSGESPEVSETRRRPSAESIASGEQRLLRSLREVTHGEYEVLSEIGRGGMAVVFLAYEPALRRKVAIKCMAPALTLMDRGIQERFKREARTAASLSHPHIIPVYAVKESPDLVYFVMKYVEGRSLESVLKEVGPLPIPVIQTILNQAGAALGHAHRHGVVHRDVKPGNVMLDQDGWLVMTDFGIAKVAQAEALTLTGGMVGTPSYMSPEQCQGGDVTGAADQYALGVVAFEMLTGRPPFSSATMVNMIYDHCHTPPPPIQQRRVDCPPELAAAVMRMMAKNPAERFPTIEEATAAVGVAAESHDAVRTRIVTLMQSSGTAKLLEKFHTPASPAPHTRAPRQAAGSSGESPASPLPPTTPGTPLPAAGGETAGVGRRRGWIGWAASALVVTVLGVFALGRQGGTRDTPTATEVATGGAAVARLDVSPLAPTLTVGMVTSLQAVPRDATGAATPSQVSWEALDPTVATVTGEGVVRGVSPGTARVVARSDGSSATVVVTVAPPPSPAPPSPPPAPLQSAPPPVASIALTPTMLALPVGDTARLTASPRAADGSSLPDRPVTFLSSQPRVASVSAEGMVTAQAPGTAQVSAASEGRSSAVPVVVFPPTVPAVTQETTRVPPRPLPEPAATPTAPAPVDPRPEIRQLIEQYRQAIETEDLERIRRLYPAITPQQEQAWRGFFENVSELSARLEVTALDTEGDSARVDITALYEFRSDRRQTQHTGFTLRLRRAPAGWLIVNVQ